MVTMQVDDPFTKALSALLAREGRGRLVSFALACAAFVLPAYEARVPADDRPRRALRSDRQKADLRDVAEATDAAWFKAESEIVYHAAWAARQAANLAVRVKALDNAQVVWNVLECAWAAGETIRLLDEGSSAQERLDRLGGMADAISFDALTWRWLGDAVGCAAAGVVAERGAGGAAG